MNRNLTPAQMARARDLAGDRRLAAALEHERRHLEFRNPERADVGAAVVLTLVTWLGIAAFTYVPGVAALISRTPSAAGAGVWPYLVTALCFAPIAWRQKRPGPAFIASSAFTILYMAMPWPPALVLMGPWLALYTYGSKYGGRRSVPLAVVVVGVSLGISALSVSQSLSVLQAVGMFALLAWAGALGHGIRTRTMLVNEIRRAHEESEKRRIDDERLRIAREVHDIMAHSLTLMTVQADAGVASFDAHPERARESLGIIGETGRSTLRDLRSMLDVLTAGEQDSPREPIADLTCAARLVESVQEAGLDTSLQTEGDLAAVPTVVAVAAYRIVQESLTNAVRHSGASSVEVRIAALGDRAEVEVTDDGHGRSADETEPGRGLRGMQERVTALGGEFETATLPGRGFRVSARIPYPRST